MNSVRTVAGRRFAGACVVVLGWVVVTAWLVRPTTAAPPHGRPGRISDALRRRLAAHAKRPDAGLTTVEVALITAVLLGLATALVAAITIVVNRNTGQIQ